MSHDGFIRFCVTQTFLGTNVLDTTMCTSENMSLRTLSPALLRDAKSYKLTLICITVLIFSCDPSLDHLQKKMIL